MEGHEVIVKLSWLEISSESRKGDGRVLELDSVL